MGEGWSHKLVLQAAAGASEPHPESIESFIEGRAFSPLSDLAPPLASVSLTGDTREDRERETT